MENVHIQWHPSVSPGFPLRPPLVFQANIHHMALTWWVLMDGKSSCWEENHRDGCLNRGMEQRYILISFSLVKLATDLRADERPLEGNGKCELGIKELLLWITQGTFCQRSLFPCILNWTMCNVTHPCLAVSWESRFSAMWEMLRNYRVTPALKEQLDWIACGISAASLFTFCTPSVNTGT